MKKVVIEIPENLTPKERLDKFMEGVRQLMGALRLYTLTEDNRGVYICTESVSKRFEDLLFPPYEE